MKHKTKTKALSWLLSLAMVLSLMPGMSLTALAWTGDPYASLLNTTTVVKFNGIDWYVIKDESSAVNEGTLTLLAANYNYFEQKNFNNYGNGNKYSSSNVAAYLGGLTNSGSFASVAGAIETIKVKGSDSDNEIDAKLWLLSTSEVLALPSAVRPYGYRWWLRSPGDDDSVAAYMYQNGGNTCGSLAVYNECAVRPAMKLDLSKVTFSSVNLSGGANAAISGGTATQNYFDMGNTRGAMTTVTYTANANYKFPESSELYKTTNGITVTRTSDTVITVSGTSTATATSIAVPDAVQSSIAVTGISLDKTTAQTIEVNGTVSFTATVAPDNATDKTVKWSVGGTDADAVKLYSNEACTTEVGADATETLTVYAKGISAGSATVTCTSNAYSEKTVSCDVTVNAAQPSTYTLTIPSTLKVANSGWNDAGGISATGSLASGKKLTVTASSANSFKLKSGNNEVGYKLATASTDTAATTSWEFTELSSTATKKDMGIIVEDYSTKPAGTYQDTVTFTASVEDARHLYSITLTGPYNNHTCNGVLRG